MPSAEDAGPRSRSTPGEVFRVFLRLGLTSFGGPVAHLGYFRDEFVARRRWIDEGTYADLVALCQFLPGPASSQVGLAIGVLRAGLPGMAAAWLGFTLPSALAMIAFAYGVSAYGDAAGSGWLHGLKAMAVAVVAQAVWGMAGSLCPDARTRTLAAAAALIVIAWPVLVGPLAGGQIAAIALGAACGRWLLADGGGRVAPAHTFPIGRRTANVALALFVVLLVGLPLAAWATSSAAVAVVDGFYRSGSLVFGGGHVLLPLLQAVVVPPGWVAPDSFLAGYGAAQAVPGPLFTFSAYLGTAMTVDGAGWLGGWTGGLICLFSVFAPSFLLIAGALPYWDALRTRAGVASAMAGVNAAVVGLLLAALYDPVWTSGVRGPGDFAIVVVALTMLVVWKVPPWAVAVVAAVLGAGFEAF